MSGSSERLMVDTREAPSAGFSATIPGQPWQGDFPTAVVTDAETLQSSGADLVAGPTNIRGAWVTVTDPISEGLQPDGSPEITSNTISSPLPSKTPTTSWTSMSTTEEIRIPHSMTGLHTPINDASKSNLILIIIGSVVGFILAFIAITMCSVHCARKHFRREKRKTYEDVALDEVLRSGTITSKGQEIGLERLQEASKRKWGAEEFVMRVLEEPGSEQRSLRVRAGQERALLESMFERGLTNANRNNGGFA